MLEQCPDCGSEDLSLWAEDGESDKADFWECNVCKVGGMIVDGEVGAVVLRMTPSQTLRLLEKL